MYNLITKMPRFLILSIILLINLNIAYAQTTYSKSGKPQDEAFCKMQGAETRGINDNKCIKAKIQFIGYEYQIELNFAVVEDYKNILGQYKFEEDLENLERSDICARQGVKKGERNYQCLESKKMQTQNKQLLAKNCMDNSKSLIKTIVDNKIYGEMNVDNFVEENNRRPGTTDDVLGCLVTLKFQDKGVMCSLTNKLLNHVTKEDNKILAKTVKINEKESIK